MRFASTPLTLHAIAGVERDRRQQAFPVHLLGDATTYAHRPCQFSLELAPSEHGAASRRARASNAFLVL